MIFSGMALSPESLDLLAFSAEAFVRNPMPSGPVQVVEPPTMISIPICLRKDRRSVTNPFFCDFDSIGFSFFLERGFVLDF
jgi:hypothetical protein